MLGVFFKYINYGHDKVSYVCLCLAAFISSICWVKIDTHTFDVL